MTIGTVNRRIFLKTICYSCVGLPLQIDTEKQDGTKDRREELLSQYIKFQKRQIKERAVLFKKLIAKFGPRILHVVQDHTIEETKNSIRKRNIEYRNLKAVIEILWEPSRDILSFEVKQMSPAYLEIRVSRCLFASEMRKYNAVPIGFAFYCAYDYGFCEGLNPNIRFSRTKTLMEGNDCCNHTYKLKKDI